MSGTNEILWLDKEVNRLKDIIIKAGLHHKAPCCICGYNGKEYFSTKTHDCMQTQEELSMNNPNKTSNWQPIETAPKDGRTILVCDSRTQDSCAVVGYDNDVPHDPDWCWTTGDQNYHKDLFTDWRELPEQPKVES